MNKIRVSMVADARETKTRNAKPAAILEQIKAGRWRKKVAAVRNALATHGKEAADELKKTLPGILWTGRFRRRANNGLEQHAGFLCADLDKIPGRVAELHDALRTDAHVAAAFVSPSGNGLKVVFRIQPDADKHAASFAAVREYLRTRYDVTPDENAKDLARLCYVSDDPGAWWNPHATPLETLNGDAPARPTATRTLPATPGPLPPSVERLWASGAAQGGRNAAAFNLACQCRDAGKAEGEAQAIVLTFAGRCAPPLPEGEARAAVASAFKTAPRQPAHGTPWRPPRVEASSGGRLEFDSLTAAVRGRILETLRDKDATPAEQRRLVADAVVAGLCTGGRLYYHAEHRDFDSCAFFDGTGKRLLRIRGDEFGAWLSDWLAINRADNLFKFVMAAIETAALAGHQTTGILPEAYWTARPGALYLSTGDGAAVKVTGGGVALVDNGADGVLFAAGRTLAPWRLVEPQDPFETCTLFRDAHATAGHAPDLLQLWLYSLPTNPRSKPPIVFAGEQGAGKTRLAKGIAEFYGLPFVAAKVEEALENNFWPACDAGGLLTLDNADTRCRWLADALAAAATDGCSQRRRLYTDSETITLRARAWLCVTSANPTFGADAGLADRLLLVRMARREEDQTSDAALTDEILAARDAGLSHVAETLRTALADTAPTPARLNARHPDFAAFAVRIGRALGREAEAVAALRTAEADKSRFCLENDPVASALLCHLADAGGFRGTAAELAPALVAIDGELADRCTPRRLSKRLVALWPHLKATLATAKRDEKRDNVAVFTLKSNPSAGFAGFGDHVS